MHKLSFKEADSNLSVGGGACPLFSSLPGQHPTKTAEEEAEQQNRMPLLLLHYTTPIMLPFEG